MKVSRNILTDRFGGGSSGVWVQVTSMTFFSNWSGRVATTPIPATN